jgi:hypothetical protein
MIPANDGGKARAMLCGVTARHRGDHPAANSECIQIVGTRDTQATFHRRKKKMANALALAILVASCLGCQTLS